MRFLPLFMAVTLLISGYFASFKLEIRDKRSGESMQNFSGLRKVDHVGSGESLCKTPVEWRTSVNNVEINLSSAVEITEVLLYCFKAQPIKLELSERKTIRCWGTAYCRERRVILYRHSVAILLHEVAHILAFDKSEYARGHGLTFANTLDACYSIYFTYLKSKQRKES